MTIAEIPADKPIQVGALVFPWMDPIDLAGPFDVLFWLPNTSVKLLWESNEPIRYYRGLGLIPDAKMPNAGEIDLLVMPGGPGQEDLIDRATPGRDDGDPVPRACPELRRGDRGGKPWGCCPQTPGV